MIYEQLPYTNFHDINLDWILRTLRTMESELQDFVFMNTIKYADPIQWNITTQYAKNTIVIDPATGDAYISTRPVPAGVLLDNTDYWSVIFNYQAVVNNIKENIACDVGSSSTTPVDLKQWDLIWWNDGIYGVMYDIVAGTGLIEGTNVFKTTVDEKFQLFSGMITQVSDDLAQEILDRDAADVTLGGRIDQEILDRKDADDTLDAADTALGGRIDQEILDRQDADNNIISLIQATSLFINVKEYGAVGDGIANDTVAIRNAFAAAENERSTVWFPDGTYLISSRIRVYSNTRVLFDNDATLKLSRVTSNSFGPALCFGEYGNDSFANSYEGTHDVLIENMKFDGGFDALICTRSDTHGGGTVAIGACARITLRNCVFNNCYNDHYLDIAGSTEVLVEGCKFYAGGYVGTDYSYEAVNTDFMTSGGFPHYGNHDNKGSKNITITNCYFEGFTGTAFAIGNHSLTDASGFLERLVIKNNQFKDMDGCIKILKASASLFDGNIFANVAQNTGGVANVIRLQDCRVITITNNIFREVHATGPIYIFADTTSWIPNVIVSNNNMHTVGDAGTSLTGVRLNKASGFQVNGNLFNSMTGRAVWLEGCRDGSVCGNNGRAIGTSLDTVTAVNLESSTTRVTITDNYFTDCPGDIVRVGSASNYIKRNNLQTTFSTS